MSGVDEMAKTRLIKHSSLSYKIYGVLKEQIINEELKAGERLLDDELASNFGVSRTPVREALTRLSSESLVEIVPRGGFYVRKLSREDIEEIYEIRKVLEGLAARKVALLISDREMERLSALFEKARFSTYKERIELDVKLHNLIIKSCHNKRLARIMSNLYSLIHIFRVRIGKNKEILEEAFCDHQAIFQAIKMRDAEKAERMMMEHVERSKNYIFEMGLIE
ncbi:GntR family transcriptional regulator [Candidatus Aerophobetes bacterium]|nr:GntR family transcriptional regulator [Candidatus Aerophobetes bacterium]